MSLPNLLIVGTAKSGTRTLMDYLNAHPETGFCTVGEPNFFAWEDEYRKGLDHYRSMFAHCADRKVRGEKSWRYSVASVYPQAIDRCFEHLPEFKVLYVVRNPIKRAISFWTELRDNGVDIVDRDFETALFETPLIWDSFLHHSAYSAFRDRVPEGQAKVMYFEDMRTNQARFFEELCAFLDVAPFTPEDTIHSNKSIGQTEDYRLTEWARKAGAVDVLRRVLPSGLRQKARQMARRDIVKPRFSEEGRKRFVGELGEEFAAILAEGGKPADYWDLELLD